MRIYSYISDHTCRVEHVTTIHKYTSTDVIASILMNEYVDYKGSTTKEIERIIFRELRCNLGYWKCWRRSVIANNIIRGTLEHDYSILPTYSYVVNTLNLGSMNFPIIDDEGRFIYYFLANGTSIRRYFHIRKVISVDGTFCTTSMRVSFLAVVAQDTEKHIYPIAFYVVDKECDDSWTFFFSKLKLIVAVDSELYIIFDRHVSIANGIARVYEHAHHGL